MFSCGKCSLTIALRYVTLRLIEKEAHMTLYKSLFEFEETPHNIKYPQAYHNVVKCRWCRIVFGASRSTAHFCTSACRQANYRAEKRRRETGSYA